MTSESFALALQELIGRAEPEASRLFHLLFHAQQRSAEIQEEVSEANIQNLHRDIERLEMTIEATRKNNAAHTRSIYACSHLLGTLVIKNDFGESFRLRYLRDKFQRLCELTDRKIESSRTKLSAKPRRIRSAAHMKDPFYLQIVREYIETEARLSDEKETAEISEIDTEARVFALVDEVTEYDLVAKRLNLDTPDFNPSAALRDILGCATSSDSDSSAN
jgi:hypothetical protein